MEEKMLLRDGEEGLVFEAQLANDRKLCPLAEECFAIKDKKVFYEVCSNNSRSCRNFIQKNPVSKEDYESGNYAIESVKDGKMFAVSGGIK